MKIPLCIPEIGEEEISRVTEVLKSGWLAHGPQNKEFEKNFAEYLGVKHAITLNSCTSALQLAIQALEIKGEVLVPSFTFVASANAIVTSGAKPVFVDIDSKTFNIDPNKIEEKINANTQAIMVVHYAGQMCDMGEIKKIADKHNLYIIEDSAECIGGTFAGKKSGNFGIGCFSFFPTKNLTVGEGGMLTTNDDAIAEKVRTLLAHGISSTTFEREKLEKPWFRAASTAGYNYRLCDVLAAIGVVQLKKLDWMNEKRRENAQYLIDKLSSINKIELPFEDPNCLHVYQMFVIKLDKSINRGEFVTKLKEKGIGVSVHFDPPVHLQPFYRSFVKEGELAVTEDVVSRIVTLPMYPSLKMEELDYLINSIKEVIKQLDNVCLYSQKE